MSATPTTPSQVSLPPISFLLGSDDLRDFRMSAIPTRSSQVSLPPISFLLGSDIPVVPTQIESSRIRQCNSCSSTKTSHWYKDPNDPTLARCRKCYLRAQVERTDKECATCHATSSSQWHKDPNNPVLDRCRKCYYRARKIL